MKLLSLALTVLLLGCSPAVSPAEPTTAPEPAGEIEEEGVETQEQEEVGEDGRYSEDYYAENGAEALASAVIGNGERSLLFFYAAWCPFCVQKEALLRTLYGAEDFPLSIYKIDYDQSTELKARYGVTTQDTVILIDGAGQALQTVVGATETDLRMLLHSPE